MGAGSLNACSNGSAFQCRPTIAAQHLNEKGDTMIHLLPWRRGHGQVKGDRGRRGLEHRSYCHHSGGTARPGGGYRLPTSD
ncbi:hypothetical protein ACOMHN_005988 [Nucella lapillus]